MLKVPLQSMIANPDSVHSAVSGLDAEEHP